MDDMCHCTPFIYMIIINMYLTNYICISKPSLFKIYKTLDPFEIWDVYANGPPIPHQDFHTTEKICESRNTSLVVSLLTSVHMHIIVYLQSYYTIPTRAVAYIVHLQCCKFIWLGCFLHVGNLLLNIADIIKPWDKKRTVNLEALER